MVNTRKKVKQTNRTMKNSSALNKIKMTNRLLGLQAYRSESNKSKYERIASYVLQHDENQTLKMTHIEKSQSLQHIGKSIVEIVSSAYHMDNNDITSQQQGGGGGGCPSHNHNNGLYNTRERCIRNINTLYT